jgi:formate/nitrite transporter FocA (FNT family)
MFIVTVDQFAAVAAGKAGFLRRSPVGFWISSMMAGAYVGLGIILIFCVGANVDPGIRPVVMGASFGIALLADHPPTVSLAGLAWNLLWVTLGNVLSGAGIMGIGYWAASQPAEAKSSAARLAAAE